MKEEFLKESFSIKCVMVLICGILLAGFDDFVLKLTALMTLCVCIIFLYKEYTVLCRKNEGKEMEKKRGA